MRNNSPLGVLRLQDAADLVGTRVPGTSSMYLRATELRRKFQNLAQ